MNLIKIISQTVITISIIIINTNLLFAQNETKLFDQLETLYNQPRKVELFELLGNQLKNAKTAEDISTQLKWLHEKTFNDSRTFRIPAYYAFYLKKAGYADESSRVLLFAFLQQQIDYRRCKHQRRADGKYEEWHQAMLKTQILDPHLKNQNKEVQNANLKFAVNLESQNANRPGDEWLCGGINWSKWSEENKEFTGKEVTSSQNLGETIEINPSEEYRYKAEYIDDTEFDKMREELAVAFSERFTLYAQQFKK